VDSGYPCYLLVATPLQLIKYYYGVLRGYLRTPLREKLSNSGLRSPLREEQTVEFLMFLSVRSLINFPKYYY